jgi:hypothetical protein
MRWLTQDPDEVCAEIEKTTGATIAPWVKDRLHGKLTMVEEIHPDGSKRTRCADCRAWHNPIYSGDPEIQKWNDSEVRVCQVEAGVCSDCGKSLFRGEWTDPD